MDKIGAYNAYQRSYAETVSHRKNEEVKKQDHVKKANESEKASKKEAVNLSSKAKELLKELQKKYANMDFMIADYETEEEASALLARGTKEYSVLIEPDVLEQMAAEEDVKEKYMGLIESSTSQLKEMKEKLSETGEEITHLGISIQDDGTAKFFAKLEQQNEQQREQIQNAKEARKEEKAKEAKETEEEEKQERLQKARENTKNRMWNASNSSKSVFLEADSIEELLSKIKNVDWEKVQSKEAEGFGNRLDLTV